MRAKYWKAFVSYFVNLPERNISLVIVGAFLFAILAIFLPISLFSIHQLVNMGEIQEVERETNRVIGIINHELDQMEKSNRDWAHWDETYQFAQDGNQKYIDDNLTEEVLANLGINLFMITDHEGKVKALFSIDLHNNEQIDPPFEINNLLEKYPIFLQHPDENSSHHGIAIIESQAILVTSLPVLTSARAGPVMGTMIFGVYLDEAEVEVISSISQRDVNFWPLTSSQLPGLKSSQKMLEADTDILAASLDDEMVAGYKVLADIAGQPAVILQTNVPRGLYKLGRSAARIFSGIFIFLCLALNLILYNFVNAYLRTRSSNRQTLERFQAVFDQSSDAILLVDSAGYIADANHASQKMLCLTLNPEQKTSIHDIFTSDPPLDLTTFNSSKSHHNLTEYHLRLNNGKSIDIEMSGSEIFNQKSKAYSIILRDITERKQADTALRGSEERYQLAVQGANDGLWDWDLLTDKIFFSTRWKSMLGYDAEEISNSPEEWFSRIHPDDLLALKAKLAHHLDKRTDNFEAESRMLHKDGDYRWVLSRGVAVWHGAQFANRMAGSLTDITAQKRIEEQLRHDALHDALTGLGNRTLLLDRLNHTNLRKKRKPEMIFALFFLDLDRFKQVNDTYGHHTGDQILIETSHRLGSNLRSLDTIARANSPETLVRIAGDEFVILVEDIRSLADIDRISNRIQTLISQPFLVNGNEICISASIGIVIPDQSYDLPEEIIRDADIAMYRAKQKGGAAVVRFTREMYESTAARMQLEKDLRRAIEKQEFELYYQPIFALQDDRVIGFEALIRWNHPARGILLPKDFIDLAEESGLIVPMGYWVLREACLQMKCWQQDFGLAEKMIVSVNMSARQLSATDLVEKVISILDETAYTPANLWLEITETTLIENLDAMKECLNDLRGHGIHIKIDDFGVGYSSLSYIQNLPIDGFKIDRSFINEIAGNGQQIVNTLVALGQNLRLMQVAEGVETQAQKDYLRKLSCDYMQGYLMARPMSKEMLEQFLKDQQPISAPRSPINTIL